MENESRRCPNPSESEHVIELRNPPLDFPFSTLEGSCSLGHRFRIRIALVCFPDLDDLTEPQCLKILNESMRPSMGDERSRECPRCKGSGNIEAVSPCREYGGTGWWVGSFSWEVQQGSRGRIPGPSGDMCRICDGRGSLVTKVACSECETSGRVRKR